MVAPDVHKQPAKRAAPSRVRATRSMFMVRFPLEVLAPGASNDHCLLRAGHHIPPAARILAAIPAMPLCGRKASGACLDVYVCLDEYPRAIATVNSTIRALRAVLNHAVKDDLIDVAPKFKILSGANVRSWILSPEQEPKYLAACTEPLRTVVTIILDAGLRPDECFRLQWKNVRWIDDKRAVLIVPGTKTEAASRIVPMTPRLRAIIHARWQDKKQPTNGWVFPAKKASVGHIVPNTIYQPHLDAVKNSGICEKQFVLYALRHTCLSRWGASGMDAWTLARLAGHSSIKQSMTYVHPTDKSLHAAIDRMSELPSVVGGDKSGDNAETP